MNWGLHPNLSFTFENKMGNRHKAGRISNISNVINETCYFLKFQELINELGKICFSFGEQWNFELNGILHIPQNF